MVPSPRVVVPSSDAFTPLRACGVPLVRKGGQFCTQLALLQVDAVPESATNRYRVLPLESTRIDPSLLLPTAIAAPAACGLAVVLGDATTGAVDGCAVGAVAGAAP